jgi:hypothetical protein
MNTLDNLVTFKKEMFELKTRLANENEEIVKNTCKNGNISMEFGISALYAAWQTFCALPDTKCFGNNSSPLTTFMVANHLSWLCNTAMAIRSLILQGLEPQARVLTRSFVEAIYQTLVLFYDEESYAIYLKGIGNDGSKEAYYNLFSKKQRLQKKLQILETEAFERIKNEQSFNLTTDRTDQLKQRVDMLEHYSQATHASFLHILMSALQPDDQSNLHQTILGRVTTATENTLLNCTHEICYFSVLFDHIVKNVWKIPDISNNPNYDIFWKSMGVTAKCRDHKVKNK